MVLAILLLFSTFAIAAVVVDLGLASLEQQRMQDAADAAAIEGLRGGRAEGATFAAVSMSAFHALAPDADVEVVGGEGEWNANASLALTGRFVPQMQANAADAPHGDFVGGTYFANAAHTERSDYLRDDFAAGAGDRALLARLRRTLDPLGLDAEDQVASRGPPLPFLFGRAALIDSADGTYDPRRDGITVRATAVADGRPANAVHVSFGGAGDLPVAPFSVEFALWTATDVDAPILGLSSGTTARSVPSTPVLRAGDAVAAGGVVLTLPLGVAHVVPLFTDSRLVAFGLAEATAAGLIKRRGANVTNATALDRVAAATFELAGRDDLALAPVLVR
ncbi:MAG: hypothetical protein IPH13_17135 [Planctomycetes bacterium]|nr:hypothetical protein [Planctomycetota bacterium]